MLLKNLDIPEAKLALELQQKLAIYNKVNVSTRTKPMRILVLGSARTGTTSLLTALHKLGYRTYHMHTIFKNPSHFDFWINAIRAKFGGIPIIPDFDKVVGDYDAVSDVPICLFAPELIAAYPDAKVILTTRSREKWVESMRATIWKAHSWWTWDWLAMLNPGVIRGFVTQDELVWDAFMNSSVDHLSYTPARRDYFSQEYRETAMRKFQEHNDYVKSLVPKENLLEFQPQHGWKPLCEFLGHQTPAGEYPRSNQKDDHINKTTMLWYIGLITALLKIAACLALILLCLRYL